jgi:hypothetical protein
MNAIKRGSDGLYQLFRGHPKVGKRVGSFRFALFMTLLRGCHEEGANSMLNGIANR